MNDGWNEWAPRVPDPRMPGSPYGDSVDPAWGQRPDVPPPSRGEPPAGPGHRTPSIGWALPAPGRSPADAPDGRGPAAPPAWAGQAGPVCPLPRSGDGPYGRPPAEPGTGADDALARRSGTPAPVRDGRHVAVPPQARFEPPQTGGHLPLPYATPEVPAGPSTANRPAPRPALGGPEPSSGRLAVPQTGYHIVRFHAQATRNGLDRPDGVPGRHAARPPLAAGPDRPPEEAADRPLRWGDERILRRLAEQGLGWGYRPVEHRPRHDGEPVTPAYGPDPYDDEAMDGPTMKVSAAGEIARPFITTTRRTRPLEERLRMETLLSSTPAALEAPLAFEHAHIVELCRSPHSVAEIAAALRLPVGVARELIADLVTERFLIIHAQVVLGKRPPRQLLERIRAGVRAL